MHIEDEILNSMSLRILNQGGENKTPNILMHYGKECLEQFKGNLNAVMMGIAYGGDVEAMARLWGKRGNVYGYDTFEDLHPKHLVKDKNGVEATCMDAWYKKHGTKKLSIEYQRKVLKKLKLDNVTLTKGEVHNDSCKDIDKIHLAFLDMDITESMKSGYKAIENKFVTGGLLFIHDFLEFEALGFKHKRYRPLLPGISKWVYHELIKQKDKWNILQIDESSLLIVLQKL